MAKGEWYAFEKGATKTTGGEGWADVWKRERFGWEYKSKGKDLRAAFAQLQRYAPALENPPLLIVCDLARFEIHTNWTNTVSHAYEIGLEELVDSRKLRWLKWAFTDPEQLKPGLTRQALTVRSVRLIAMKGRDFGGAQVSEERRTTSIAFSHGRITYALTWPFGLTGRVNQPRAISPMTSNGPYFLQPSKQTPEFSTSAIAKVRFALPAVRSVYT
jgi:hypothetical protein